MPYRMRIAITGGKGGTGKSIVATSLAVQFAEDKKTMLIDADAECPNDHLLLSIGRKKHSKVFQPIPRWDFDKCSKCGKCAQVCKQESIAFVKGKYPAFVKDTCIGCKACIFICPNNAISEEKREIGTIYVGNNYGVSLVSGELKIGELASGEIVSEVKKESERINEKLGCEVILIDSAAGIGCPVIASLTGTDYIIAVTEPTPSALHDLKRVLYLADNFKINYGIVINKYGLEKNFCRKIEEYAEKENIPILGKIPFDQDFVKSTIKMMPVVEFDVAYKKLFDGIIRKIYKLTSNPR